MRRTPSKIEKKKINMTTTNVHATKLHYHLLPVLILNTIPMVNNLILWYQNLKKKLKNTITFFFTKAQPIKTTKTIFTHMINKTLQTMFKKHVHNQGVLLNQFPSLKHAYVTNIFA